MKLIPILCAIVLIVACADGSNAQQTGPSFTKSTSDVADSTPAIPDAATEAQIREYLRVSGEVQKFRDSWIAAVDQVVRLEPLIGLNHSGKLSKTRCKRQIWFQCTSRCFNMESRETLCNKFLTLTACGGRNISRGLPECFKLGTAVTAVQGEFEKLKLDETQAVVSKVYAEYKPQIKAARARYLAEHPDWKDK